MDRRLASIASLLAFIAVGLGAFGTHGLRSNLTGEGADRLLETWQTAVHYHLVHAVAMLAIAILAGHAPKASRAGWGMAAGIAIFSGSLYLYVLTRASGFAMVTPLGGAVFLASWLGLARVVWRA